MKKILIGLTIITLAAMVASPAMAYYWPMPMESSDVTVNNDSYSRIRNNVTVVAKTGDNTANTGSASFGGLGSTIQTGNAVAEATVVTVANTNYTRIKAPCTNCDGDVTVNNDDSDAFVRNRVRVIADTGDNTANTGSACLGGEGSLIVTGSAWAEGNVVTVTNTNITRIRR